VFPKFYFLSIIHLLMSPDTSHPTFITEVQLYIWKPNGSSNISFRKYSCGEHLSLYYTIYKLTSTRQHYKYLLQYICYMFRPVNRTSSGLQQNESQVLFRYGDPNIFAAVNVQKIQYWVKCETHNVWLKQVKTRADIWHFGQVLSPLEYSLEYGRYCTFIRCGGTCVVQPVMVVQFISNWRSVVATLYSLYFQFGKLCGSALC
jgi:hypothetical protein